MRHIFTTNKRESFAKTASIINNAWALMKKVNLFVNIYMKTLGQKSLLKAPATSIPDTSFTNVDIDKEDHSLDMNAPIEQINEAMKLYNLKANLGGNTVTSTIKSDTTKTYMITSIFDEETQEWEPHLANPDLTHDTRFREDDPVKPLSLFKNTATTILLMLFSVLGVFANKAASIDLSLRSIINNSAPSVGNSVKFTIWLKNQGATTASTIVVKNSFPISGVNLTSNTGGVNFSYTSGTGIGLWSVSTLAAGDSVSLEMTGTVTQRGVYFNIAEINSIAGSDTDSDSTPGNGNLSEDDMTTACFSVPLRIYSGEQYTVLLPTAFKKNNTVKWYRNNVQIIGSIPEAIINADTSLTIKAIGNYTFTTTVGGCTGQGCCTIQAIAGPYGSIGNFVWKDKNDNGLQDSNEPGIQNVILELYTVDNQGHVSENPIQKDTTDASGNYLFQNLLSGGYLVKVPFSNLSDTLQISKKKDTGSDDTKDHDFSSSTGYSAKTTIHVDSTGSKRNNLTVDAALYTPVGSIGDWVWNDANNNGIQNQGEAGVPNIILELYKADDSGNPSGAVLAKDTSDANGFYKFLNVIKGDYVVKLLKTSLQAGTIMSSQINLGVDDNADGDFNSTTALSAKITLDPYNFNIDPLNKENLTVDAALYTPLGSIGDYIWKDVDNDGIQDIDEPGVQGVILQLYAAGNDGSPTGNILKTDTTDANGHYLFSGLSQGNYVIKLLTASLPVYHSISTMIDSGGNDTKDSDFNATNGYSAKIIIDPTVTDTKDILSVDCALREVVVCPTLTVSSINNEICAGDSTTVKGITSNSASIKWYLTSTGGIPVFTSDSNESHKVFPTTTTTYYAEINDLHLSCPNTRLPLIIVANASPATPSCASAVDACQGETVNLNNYIIDGVTTAGGTFEWRTTALKNSPLVTTPSSVGAGTYYLFEKSGAGCYSSPKSLKVTIKNCSIPVDLSLTKFVNNNTPNVSDNITYTITVTNQGQNAATNVEIEDQMPSGLEFISGSFFTRNGNILTGTIPSIAPAQTIILTYVTKVTLPGTKINFAQINKADQKDIDSTPGNATTAAEDDNSKIIINPIQSQLIADLSLDKTVNKSMASIGEQITYYITIINNGSASATNVEVQDIVPAGLEVVTVSGANSITVSGNDIKAKFNQIDVGYAATFQIIAVVTASSGVIRNAAQITKSDQLDSDSVPDNGTENEEDDTDYTDVTIANGVCNPPSPLIATSNPFICVGESITLTSVGCTGTTVWSTGSTGNSIIISPITNTTYTAKCRLSNDCIGSDSNPIAITVNSIVPPLITSNAPNNAICTGGSVTLSASTCSGSVVWSNGTTASGITLSPITNTTYTAICKTNNCVSNSSSPVTITVSNNSSAPGITANKSTICSGETTVLTASGCSGSLTWSNGSTGTSISISPSTTGTYSVICTLSGCGSQTSAPLTITVLPAIGTPVITVDKELICAGSNAVLSASGCTGTLVWSNGVSSSSITVSPLTTTAYEVTCKVGQCTAKTSKNITVNPQPAAPVITSAKMQICSGESVILTANNCDGSVKWSNGATIATVTASPTTTATYTATCTINGCSSVASSPITIVVTTIASPTITATRELVCKGNSSVLTASNCSGSLLWNSGQTTSSIIVSPVATFNYTVTCTVGNCESTASKTITVNTQPTMPPVISASNTILCTSGDVTLTATGCTGIVLWSNTQTGTTITVNVSSDIVFAAACKVDDCESEKSNSINVTVSKINKPTISASISTICVGDTIELNSSACVGNTIWSNGLTGNSIRVNPVITTEYTAVCKQSEGNCTSENSNSLTITLATQPTPPSVTTSVKNICPATTVNLTNVVTSAPRTTGGVFEFRSGATRNSPLLPGITEVGAGTYYVFEKSTAGCHSSGTPVTVSISNCTNNPTDTAGVELGVQIIGSSDVLSKGDHLTYTITVTNNTMHTATNVGITNILPKGITIISSTPGLTAFGTDSLISVIGSLPGGAKMTYTYIAQTTKAGIIRNTVKITKAGQPDPILSNNSSYWDVHCSTCQEVCTAVALAADTTRQSNGSYDIAFTALVENCGNVKLESVKLTENLISMFPSLVTYTIKQAPVVGIGSKLVPNANFNGSSDLNLIVPEGSQVESGVTDTVKFIINIFPNGNNGPFSTNALAEAKGFISLTNAFLETSDVSNNGKYVNKPSAEPTVIKLFKSPSIGLAKIVSDTTKKENGSYDVTYQLLVKNNGSLPLTNVVLTDTLSKVFKLPATFTVTGTPVKNAGSHLVINNAFNGVSDTRLTLQESTLVVGQTDTLKFSVNLQPDTVKLFSNTAVVNAKGKLGIDPEEDITDLSNAGTNPDAPGSNPTNLNLELGDLTANETPCIGLTLYVKDTFNLGDGSYNVVFRSIIKNCGNIDLINIQLCDTLSNTFTAPVVATIALAPTVSAGSQLVPDPNYNGIGNTCLLSGGSTLAVGKTDTIQWIVNVRLNGNKGPFTNSMIVSGQTHSGKTVSDVSNNGTDPNPAGSIPTVINFNELPAALIGISKEVIDKVKVGDKSYGITFKFNVKNYGKTDFTGVQVQDNLAVIFGDSVRIDSISVKADPGFVVNSDFTGRGSLINMLVDSLSTLPVHTTRSITLFTKVTITEGTKYFENEALAIGRYPTNATVDDRSTNGSNPDSNNNGDPRDDMDRTPIDLRGLDPITPLGIAKWAKLDSVQNPDNSYNLTYRFVIKNYGATRLTHVQLSDSLESIFGDSDGSNFLIVGTPTLNNGSHLKLNREFNGGTITTLLVADSSYLEAGVADTLELKLRILNTKPLPATFENSAYGSAKDSTATVADISHEGINPDPDENNNPGDNNDPTVITISEQPVVPDSLIIIPGGFSPNHDHVGDTFFIPGISNTAREARIYIYNRWGVLVYQNEDYGKSDGWDGIANNGIILMSNGMEVPDGTYYFVLDVKGLWNNKPKIGFLTIAK